MIATVAFHPHNRTDNEQRLLFVGRNIHLHLGSDGNRKFVFKKNAADANILAFGCPGFGLIKSEFAHHDLFIEVDAQIPPLVLGKKGYIVFTRTLGAIKGMVGGSGFGDANFG